MKALILSDGKPGHVNQARALCGLMGWPYREVVVRYPFRPVKGAGYVLDWLGVWTETPFVLHRPDDTDHILGLNEAADGCGVIAAVGSAAYYPAKVAAGTRRLPAVALMYPRGFKKDFAHILCPAYDHPPNKANVTALPITLCGRDRAYYDAMTEDFGRRFGYRLPAAGVIIGGDNHYERLCPERLGRQLEALFALTPNHQHWVTTSRRTGSAAEAVVERFDFDYTLIFSRQQYNPIPAFLMLSDYLFVTSDSASMLSECVCTGRAKVEVLKNVTRKKSKFDAFLDDLQARGCVHLFDGQLGQADQKIDIGQTVRTALADLVPGEEAV